MRGVMLEVPPGLLEERARLGLDRRDEMWEGEVHLVPPPMFGHNRIVSLLHRTLGPRAEDAGLEVSSDTGVWATGEDPESWRVPDFLVVDMQRVTERGVESGTAPLLVVEVRSPGDESYRKLDFYDRVGVTEYLVVDLPEGVLRRYTRRRGALAEITGAGGARTVSLDTLPGVAVRLAPDSRHGVVVETR